MLWATVLGSGVAFLDSTAVNVALPTIGRELGATLSGLQWSVDAYLLSLSALLLVGGSLGDAYGRRRIFLIGLLWFTLASVLCGLAPSIGWLVAMRALQGVGAALLVPNSLAILRSTFVARETDVAIGMWAGLSGVTTAIGPLVGGWLVGAVSWRVIFFLNLPLAGIAAWAAWRFVPARLGEIRPAQLDLAGSVLAVVTLGALILPLIEGARLGWTHPVILGSALVGVLGAAAFGLIESRRRQPMLPLRLFRSRQFSGANLTTLAAYFGFGGAIFLLVMQLQYALRYSPLQAGAALLPITLLTLVLSPQAGKLTGRVGHRWMMTAGPLIVSLGLLLLARVGPGTTYARGVLPGVVVVGLGLSTTVAPLTAAVLAGIEPSAAGIASGVNNAVARFAGLLAVALLPLAGGITGEGAQFSGGFSRAMALSAAVCAVGGLCAWLTVDRRPATRRDLIQRGEAPRPT